MSICILSVVVFSFFFSRRCSVFSSVGILGCVFINFNIDEEVVVEGKMVVEGMDKEVRLFVKKKRKKGL